ncbi:MAG: alkaline phosphatase family protein [Bacteroidetes bacterium]|nr:alkaline phosphatase family protein [Bacteroidota bacterium]
MRNLKLLPLTILLLFFTTWAFGQQRPRLVVGIIVDQMRYDYLYRYWDDLSENGFKRLLQQGYVVHNGHYQYAPTLTGPGHSSVYTGSSPALHGIIGNEWYSRQEKKRVYCAEDQQANTVGSNSVEGKMSPRRLTATTLADQLELATNRRSKTIGIALKDRGAILPVGFLNDGAYWYDKTNGQFITSDFYRKTLPDWVTKFNDQHLPDQYLEKPWTPLLPMERYDESLPDERPYERPYLNTEKAVFPYDLKAISQIKRFGAGETPYGILLASPYGNALTAAFAKAAIEGEQLGMDSITDLLALSFSSTDYVGHQFGPYSVETQDIYLRLDRELANFLDYLDNTIGLDRVNIFLTADHGGADIPGYVSPPSGYFKTGDFEQGLANHLQEKFGMNPIEFFINEQIYLYQQDSIDVGEIEAEIRAFSADFPGVYGIIPLHDFGHCATDPRVCEKIRKGFMPARSGDFLVQLYPGWFSDYYLKGGTTHGSPYAYDTHVPIIFFGGNIAPGDNYDPIWIEDIAPTVSELLKISWPSGATGKVIGGVLKH